MFDLVRPCPTCPFRKGQGELFQLKEMRLASIFTAPAFQCHGTVDYNEDSGRPGNRPQQCAGLMALLHREGKPNQIMQIATRLGHLDPARLDPRQEAYASFAAAHAAHHTRHRSPRPAPRP
jgi:hypothetical protein